MVALLFTPFTPDGSRFDAAGMRRQLDFVLESGVSAVVKVRPCSRGTPSVSK